ncbi:hypothetical protein C7H85_09435 [Zobellella endophytica]|uniref:Uncharacterized protein n=1 Tax=Zobellella endophytica TaxID=2116700 RepID=A0A2P7R5W0_9GAMM|nr:hypothetical protein C7H85_09435 [Zobellella endophytica]
MNDVFLYRTHQQYFDLCFEDCWSGYFITKALSGYTGDIVLLHLDDHTDMMPTLLAQTDTGLMNPVTARIFDPSHPADWISAIKTGCISIGDFITPLFHSGRRIHVRHLNNSSPGHASPVPVSRAFCSYPEIPGYRFATLTKEENSSPGADGSYLAGPDPFTLFEALPAGKVILHIDLDYFINDFNGNVGALPPLSPKELYLRAQGKLASFLKALTPLQPRIELKIVATSPGFCCALHWNGLLQELRHGLGSFLNESEAGP